MFKIKDWARIAALQFDKLYKVDKTADLVKFCHEFYDANHITGCTVPEFECACYAEYAKI
jgi:hypothetical protein